MCLPAHRLTDLRGTPAGSQTDLTPLSLLSTHPLRNSCVISVSYSGLRIVSDQGFGPSITGSERKKGQGPSEMISGIVSGDSPISVEFTRAGIIGISDRVMRG